jgi:hypothetical protein
MMRPTSKLIITVSGFALGVAAAFAWNYAHPPVVPNCGQSEGSSSPMGDDNALSAAPSDNWEEYFGTLLVWKFLLNDERYGKIAVVRATGETSYQRVRTKLKLDCPGREAAITVLAGDMEKTGFNLGGYSVNSGLPVTNKNLVEVLAVSPQGELSFKTKANGAIGYEGLYPTVIFFELTNTRKLERLIARGSTEVTFVIHDLEDPLKTIKVTFPAIDPSSGMAKSLNGCRK